jgi:hypothetical protein
MLGHDSTGDDLLASEQKRARIIVGGIGDLFGPYAVLTGVTVTPKIYFAIGISGSIQHLVGMQNSGLIIAINSDREAPIFQASHHGIVGDAFEIVPLLIEQFNAAKAEWGESEPAAEEEIKEVHHG